jgi:hypothetical protein
VRVNFDAFDASVAKNPGESTNEAAQLLSNEGEIL